MQNLTHREKDFVPPCIGPLAIRHAPHPALPTAIDRPIDERGNARWEELLNHGVIDAGEMGMSCLGADHNGRDGDMEATAARVPDMKRLKRTLVLNLNN